MENIFTDKVIVTLAKHELYQYFVLIHLFIKHLLFSKMSSMIGTQKNDAEKDLIKLFIIINFTTTNINALINVIN